MKKNAFVLGGTSGLGLELARLASDDDFDVTIAGRTAARCSLVTEQKARPLVLDLEEQFLEIPVTPHPIHLLIWAAGNRQKKNFANLTSTDIYRSSMIHLTNAVCILNELYRRQVMYHHHPLDLVIIGSTSAWTTREDMALYGALKAAKAQLARNLACELKRDLPGSRVLLANPGGMKTDFWKDDPTTDVSAFMDPKTVAHIIWDQLHRQTQPLREIQIFRQPDGSPRLEIGSRIRQD